MSFFALLLAGVFALWLFFALGVLCLLAAGKGKEDPRFAGDKVIYRS